MVHPYDRMSSNIVNRKRPKINYLSGGGGKNKAYTKKSSFC